MQSTLLPIHFEENGSNLATFMWIRKNEVTSCKDIYDYIFVGNIFDNILRFSNDMLLQLPGLLYISLHIRLLKSKNPICESTHKTLILLHNHSCHLFDDAYTTITALSQVTCFHLSLVYDIS